MAAFAEAGLPAADVPAAAFLAVEDVRPRSADVVAAGLRAPEALCSAFAVPVEVAREAPDLAVVALPPAALVVVAFAAPACAEVAFAEVASALAVFDEPALEAVAFDLPAFEVPAFEVPAFALLDLRPPAADVGEADVFSAPDCDCGADRVPPDRVVRERVVPDFPPPREPDAVDAVDAAAAARRFAGDFSPAVDGCSGCAPACPGVAFSVLLTVR